MPELLGLVAFSFVGAVTPGPNNVLLWASGVQFGLRRSLRHVLGSALGIGGMALGVAAGIGSLVAAAPELAFGMRVGGSLYLLYLAWQVAGAGAVADASVARPVGLRQAATFQLINPKAWIVVLGAISTFRPADLPLVAGSLLAAATMTVVVVPAFALWAVGGDLLGRLLAGRWQRLVSLTLAAMVVGTVAYIWL
jgi:threonine/homoserine/homoserine lactone efflux protein